MILITGDGINLTSANVYDLSIDNYYTNGIAAEIGTAIASELTLSLKGNFDLDGKELAVKVDNIFRGYFTVDEAKRTRKGMTVSALDRMVKFDKDFTSIALPANLTTLVTDACTKCGVPYGGVTFRANSAVMIDDLPETFTYRELLMWIGEITGTCSFIDTDGKFYMRWYSGGADINKSLYYEGGEFVAEQISITGYKYKDTQVGTEGYIAEITNNQILDLRDDVDTLFGNLPLDSYYPFNVETREIVLSPLTLATFTDYDGIEYPTLVTHYTYKYGKKNKVKASGQSMTELGRKKLNPLTSHQQQIILSMKNDIETDITMREQILLSLNEQINNSVGLYVTEYEGKTYQHDKPDLEESNYITTHTTGGFAWTTDGWNDGEPVWNYGVDKDGNAILNILAVVGLVADWITTGTISSADGSVVINLDEPSFNFANHIVYDENGFKIDLSSYDLTTRNYLINSAPVVEFGEDIATSVQDFEGRNLFLAKNINLGSPSFISYQDGRYYLYSQSDGGPPTHTGLYTSLGIMTSRSEHLSKLIEVEPSTSYYFQVIEQDPEEVAGPLSVGEYASNGSNVRPVYSIPSVTNNIISYSSTRYIEVCRQSASFSMKNIMISKDNLYPYQPAPEDLTFATDYTLSEPLEIGETYTLTADTQAEWVGVWQGTDYFLGYLDDGKLTFEATAEETEIILKSYEGEQVGKVALRKGDTAWPWTPAPEDSIALEQRVHSAELKVTPEAITQTVTESQTYKDDLKGIDDKITNPNLLPLGWVDKTSNTAETLYEETVHLEKGDYWLIVDYTTIVGNQGQLLANGTLVSVLTGAIYSAKWTQATSGNVTFKIINLYGFEFHLNFVKLEQGDKYTGFMADDGDLKYQSEYISTVEQTASKIAWIVKSGTSASNMVLTDEMYSVIASNIELTADNIKLEGYTTINNAFQIDGYGNVKMFSGIIDINAQTWLSPTNYNFRIYDPSLLTYVMANHKTLEVGDGHYVDSFVRLTTDGSTPKIEVGTDTVLTDYRLTVSAITMNSKVLYLDNGYVKYTP